MIGQIDYTEGKVGIERQRKMFCRFISQLVCRNRDNLTQINFVNFSYFLQLLSVSCYYDIM